jgi:hypothetical protein
MREVVGILHNLTDMRRKASACIGLCVGMVPESYHRISYEGAKEDYADDADLLKYLESAKELLHTHYTKRYANRARSTQETTDACVPTVTDDSPSGVNFTLRYKKKENLLRDELEEYFKLPREDFDTCQPLQWWVG